MARGQRYRVRFRRRREQKTDYRRRLALVKSGKPRLVVRPSSRNTIVQIFEFQPTGDKCLTSSNALELRKMGWKAGTGNVPAAYLAGYLCGLRGKKAGVKSAELDIGHLPKSKRIFAALKGAIDAGLNIIHGEIDIPDQFISGQHIAAWAKSAPSPAFSLYKKRSLDATKLSEHIAQIKNELSKKV